MRRTTFRFALRLDDGCEAGAVGMFTTTSPIWAAGDDFYDAERERWRVVTVLEWPRTWSRRGSVDVDGVLIVVPA